MAFWSPNKRQILSETSLSLLCFWLAWKRGKFEFARENMASICSMRTFQSETCTLRLISLACSLKRARSNSVWEPCYSLFRKEAALPWLILVFRLGRPPMRMIFWGFTI